MNEVPFGRRWEWIRLLLSMKLTNVGSTLTPADKVVGTALAQFVNADTGKAWPAQQTLAESCGLSSRQVRRSLDKLAAGGLLHISRRGGGVFQQADGSMRGQACVHQLTIPAVGQASPEKSDSKRAERGPKSRKPGQGAGKPGPKPRETRTSESTKPCKSNQDAIKLSTRRTPSTNYPSKESHHEEDEKEDGDVSRDLSDNDHDPRQELASTHSASNVDAPYRSIPDAQRAIDVLYELLGEGDRQTGRQRADKLPAAWLPATVACLVRGTLTPRTIAEAIKTTST